MPVCPAQLASNSIISFLFFIDNKLIGKTLSDDRGFWNFVSTKKIPLGKLDLRVDFKLNNQIFS